MARTASLCATAKEAKLNTRPATNARIRDDLSYFFMMLFSLTSYCVEAEHSAPLLGISKTRGERRQARTRLAVKDPADCEPFKPKRIPPRGNAKGCASRTRSVSAFIGWGSALDHSLVVSSAPADAPPQSTYRVAHRTVQGAGRVRDPHPLSIARPECGEH